MRLQAQVLDEGLVETLGRRRHALATAQGDSREENCSDGGNGDGGVGSIVLAADKPAALARFYGALLKVEPQPGMSPSHWRVPWPARSPC